MKETCRITSSVNGGIEIEINATLTKRKLTEAEADLVSAACSKLYTDLQEEMYKTDPEVIKRKQHWAENVEQVFKDAGFNIIYKQQIPNEYSNSNYYACWYLVTTERGIIKVGPRSHVYNLDYSAFDNKVKADILFSNENVTKGDYYIHADSLSKLYEYLKIINSKNGNN